MKNKLTLRYFKITRCGYWSGSSKEPNHYEDLLKTLTHLETYVKGKTIEETGISRDNKEPSTFLLDICKKNGLWLLAFWNPAAESSSDEIVSLNMKSKLGQVDSSPVTAGNGKTFGFVSYFLIWPEHNFYSTILSPNATLAGRTEFEEYMLNFLWIDPNFIEKTTYEETSTDGIIHTMERTNFKLPLKINGTPVPRFAGKLAKSPSEKEYVISNYDQVTQVHNQCTVKVTSGQSSSGILKKMLPSFFGSTELFAPLKTIRVNHSVSAAFENKSNLKDWIEDWEKNSFDLDKDDCGFKLKNDDKIYWIRGNVIKCELDVNLHKENGIYPAAKILDIIDQRKDYVLNEFKLSDDS